MNSNETIRRIAIFGSTGSIGTQALEVIAANPDKFSAEILTAHSNHEQPFPKRTGHHQIDKGRFVL